MEQLIEDKKYFHEIFFAILPKHIIEQIIIKTILDEEIEKCVDKKIVEFINKHTEKTKNLIYANSNDWDNIDSPNLTIEKLDQFENNTWYIAIRKPIFDFMRDQSEIVYYSKRKYFNDYSNVDDYAYSCGSRSLDTIRNILKINEIKIIKNDLEQYLI